MNKFSGLHAGDILSRGHFDPRAFLSGEKFSAHLPEECTDPKWCKDNFWDRSEL